MTDRLWATTSCISRAMRVRSAAAAILACWSRSRSSCSARSVRALSEFRQCRTLTPSRRLATTGPDSRMNVSIQTGGSGASGRRPSPCPPRPRRRPGPPPAPGTGWPRCRGRPAGSRRPPACTPTIHWASATTAANANADNGKRRRQISGTTSNALNSQRDSPNRAGLIPGLVHELRHRARGQRHRQRGIGHRGVTADRRRHVPVEGLDPAGRRWWRRRARPTATRATTRTQRPATAATRPAGAGPARRRPARPRRRAGRSRTQSMVTAWRPRRS